MLSLAHHLEPEARNAAITLCLGASMGTWPSGGKGGFRDERFQQRRIVRQDFSAKRLDVKPDGGFHIGRGFS